MVQLCVMKKKTKRLVIKNQMNIGDEPEVSSVENDERRAL